MSQELPVPYDWIETKYSPPEPKHYRADKEEWTVCEWETHVHEVKAKMYMRMLIAVLVFWAMGVKLGVELVQVFLFCQ